MHLMRRLSRITRVLWCVLVLARPQQGSATFQAGEFRGLLQAGTALGKTLINAFEFFTRQCAFGDTNRFADREHLRLIKQNLGITHFTFQGRRNYRLTDSMDVLMESSLFVKSLPTVIFVHGYLNHPSSESSEMIVSRYLRKGGYNVLVFDCSYYMRQPYDRASAQIPYLSAALADFLEQMIRKRANPKMIHLIGFSLGAHIGGIAGREFRRRTRTNLARITGLDPAGPCFSKFSEFRLQKNDALFVDVIHTNHGILGLLDPVGDADFYANGVTGFQPECRTTPISCSHSRSWQIYADSLIDGHTLYAKRCMSWNQLVQRNCTGITVRAGFSALRNIKGIYLLKH